MGQPIEAAKMDDSPTYCEICGERSIGIATAGWRCKKHWTTESEPTFDWATGFALIDAS